MHLSEQDLILAADGELPARRKAAVNHHLESCWHCRARMSSLQNTITEFVNARNQELDGQVPPATGSRAILRARMADFAQIPRMKSTWRWAPAVGFCCALFIAILLILQPAVSAEASQPRTSLTPGETRPITLQEVCRFPDAQVIAKDIPEETQQKVFAAYGIKPSRRERFEVDYLITPDLGGAETIRNLWPQPYSARWNAKVKDKLEQRLHQLVCSGQLDLATAQRDIATDWIGAYRKYVEAGSSR